MTENGDNDKPDKPEPSKDFCIRIDRTDHIVEQEKLNGRQLRHLPATPIALDRDIYQVVPGRDDRKIKDDDTVAMHDGLRLYTVPSTINPGLASVSGRSE